MSIVRTLRLLVMLGAAGVLSVVAAGPAAAGGPTSVLLASPYSDSATALYYTDNDYAELASLLGGQDLPGSPAQAPAYAAGAPYVTVTWLTHDVMVWRLDRIFLIGDDVWVVARTSTSISSSEPARMVPIV